MQDPLTDLPIWGSRTTNMLLLVWTTPIARTPTFLRDQKTPCKLQADRRPTSRCPTAPPRAQVGLAAVILGYSTHPDEHIVIPTLSSPYGSFLRMEAVKEDLNGASFNTLLPWAVEAKVARAQAAEEEAQAEEARAAQAAAEAEARAAQATAEEATATRLVARSEVQQSVATTEARHAVDSLAETAGRPHATVFLKRHSHSNERV